MDLQPLFQTILTDVVLALLGAVLVAGLAAGRHAIGYLATQLDDRQRDLIAQIVETAVKFAEQVGLREQLEKAGKEKKRIALEFAVSLLKSYNLKVSPETLDRLIEVAVYTEINWAKHN